MTVNMLLSYAYHAKTDIAEVKGAARCGRVMIDSGAFTAHSLGKHISLDEYAEFLETWEGYYDHAVTLDVVGDPAKSKVNTAKLHARGLPVMPVFTRGESIKEFDAMVKDVGYVCVGGGVGMSTKAVTKRAALLQRRAEDLGGGIHALGVGSTRMLRSIRPYSADSSNIANSLGYGMLYFFDGTNLRNLSVSQRDHLLKYRRHLSDAEFDLDYYFKHGRIPTGQGNESRVRIASSSAVGAAAATEYLRTRYPVPAPHSTNDTDGHHTYLAVTDWSTTVAMRASAWIHGDNPPRTWKRFGRTHNCEYMHQPQETEVAHADR